jgi:hypothetical protein
MEEERETGGAYGCDLQGSLARKAKRGKGRERFLQMTGVKTARDVHFLENLFVISDFFSIRFCSLQILLFSILSPFRFNFFRICCLPARAGHVAIRIFVFEICLCLERHRQ